MLRKLFINKDVFSWAMYDWANSACAVTVMSAFVPVFLTDYWSIGVEPATTTARLGIANSLTSLLVAIITPALGALSDRRGIKKLFCFVFMLLGACSCMALYFVPKGDWWNALLAFGFCMIGFNASLVFYDALLPSIASQREADHASSLGYSLGYLGGGLLFLVNIFMTLKPAMFGLESAVEGVKWSFISVALWWLIFSLPMFLIVREPKVLEAEDSLVGRFKPGQLNGASSNGSARNVALWTSFVKSSQQLKSTFLKIKTDRNLFLFLISYWLYIDGVYTVVTMAVDFGKAIQLSNSDMMGALLLVQFLGFPCALVFSYFAKIWGCKIPIFISICAYSVAVVLAAGMTTAWQFYALAVLIGVVQGGVQALSRSFFSKMIPQENAGEYFGLFNLVGKFAAILGPLLVAGFSYLTGSPRFGLLGLLVLFGVGGWLLLSVKEMVPSIIGRE